MLKVSCLSGFRHRPQLPYMEGAVRILAQTLPPIIRGPGDGSTEFTLGVMFRVVTIYNATFTVYVLSAIALLPLESHLSNLSSNRVLR